MALVKSKTHFTRPPRAGQGRQPDLHKGRPVAALDEAQKRGSGRNNSGHITMRHQGGGHKQQYRIVDFKRNKDGITAKVERLEYDPNRSAHLALLCYVTASAATSSRRAASRSARSSCRARKHRSSRAIPADAQHPGRHDGPLRRDAARQGRADRALGRRRGAAARARRRLRAAAPALGRNPQGAHRLPRDDRRSRQRRAQPALDRQGRRQPLARHPPDGARHRR